MKKKVLRLRFGLEDGRTRTLEEVGREFDVTRDVLDKLNKSFKTKIQTKIKNSWKICNI